MARALVVLLACLVAYAMASSHSEAPGTAKIPNGDITDLYVFRSYETGRSAYTVILMNIFPLQNPFGGPNYFTISDEHFFEIYIDNTGDAREDITFQFFFGSSLGGQTATYASFPNDYVCNPNQTLVNVTQKAGFQLNIGGQMIPVPLKVVGQVTSGNTQALNWNEYYQINYIRGDRTTGTSTPITQQGSSNTQFTKPFDYAGTKSFPNYAAYADDYIYQITIPNCGTAGRVFVGQRNDPFYINLGPIFDLVNFVPVVGFPGAIAECNAKNNDLRNINVHTIALEVPTSCIIGNATANGGVIGVWSAVRQLIHQGSNHVPGAQVSRLGMPLVNEVVIGLRDKGVWNAYVPSQDAYFLRYVQYPTFPELVNILFLAAVNSVLNASLPSIAPSNLPRNDLVMAFLTGVPGINQFPAPFTAADVIRLNTSIAATPQNAQSRYGVIGGDLAGFPNGRRPGDDIVDIALTVMMGRLCHIAALTPVTGCNASHAPVGTANLTDGAPVSAMDFSASFPFFNLPVPGATTDPDPGSCPGASPPPSPSPSPSPSSSSTTGGECKDDSGAAVIVPAVVAIVALVLAIFV